MRLKFTDVGYFSQLTYMSFYQEVLIR